MGRPLDLIGLHAVVEYILESRSLTSLSLCNDAIDAEGARAIGEALTTGKASLTSLDLSGNMICDVKAEKGSVMSSQASQYDVRGITAIASFLRDTDRLQTLDLGQCDRH